MATYGTFLRDKNWRICRHSFGQSPETQDSRDIELLDFSVRSGLLLWNPLQAPIILCVVFTEYSNRLLKICLFGTECGRRPRDGSKGMSLRPRCETGQMFHAPCRANRLEALMLCACCVTYWETPKWVVSSSSNKGTWQRSKTNPLTVRHDPM